MKDLTRMMMIVGTCLIADPSDAHAHSDRNPRALGFGGTEATESRVPELSCLGLTDELYTEAAAFSGSAEVHIDGAGRLHVAARGTFAWAIYPYGDDISGPYDARETRLYFGETDFDFRFIVDPYLPGSTWTYTLPSLTVAGVNGTYTLVPRPDEPSILGLFFSDDEVGHGGTVSASGGQPVCPAAP